MVNSYSSLKMLDTCPRQFHEVKVLKLHPFRASPESEFGNRAHEALEKYLKFKTPLPAEFAAYQWVCEQVIDTMPGAQAEYEFSFDRTGNKVGARDWTNKFWMGLADVLDIDGTHAFVLDYKTGKSKFPDVEQLELMAMFTFLAFPVVETVSGLLLFLQDGVTAPEDGSARWSRAADFDRLWTKWTSKARQAEVHAQHGAWPEKPNNLCAWCPSTTCQHKAPAVARRESKAARFNNK